jgi:hypothetical protein
MLGRLEEAEADRAAVAETNPVRDFLALLENEGVRLELYPNGRSIKFTGQVMRSEHLETYQRLNPNPPLDFG